MPARRLLLVAALAVVTATSAACVAPPPPPGHVSVMGASAVPADKIAAWFRHATRTPYRASVTVETLAAVYVDEGGREGVRGDIAFVQGVLETGWFGFSGSVTPAHNNFAGIGATDAGGAPARFPNATIGVRAQIQHLRAYADRTATRCTSPPLHAGCVDPRFHLVSPKGKAPTWNVMGNGNWASDPSYASKVLSLYNQMRTFAGLPRV
jgi:Mannosyl-glycoprotein endo-beta-N-acetylglucosaminidase